MRTHAHTLPPAHQQYTNGGSSNATFVTVTHQTREHWTLAAHRVFAYDTHRKLAHQQDTNGGSSNATLVTVTHQTRERWTLAAHRVFAHDTHRKLARLIRLRLTFHPAARTKVASFLKVLGLWLTVTASLDSSAWCTAFT